MIKDCEFINTCDNIVYSRCVRYEGFISDISPLKGKCDISVHEALEDIYKTLKEPEGISYINGEGLNLDGREFSVAFGTTATTAKRGDWTPYWDDVKNRPDIPEQVQLRAGNNITLTGTYPNITINANNQSAGKIESISINNQQLVISPTKNVDIPLATTSNLGVIKVGTNLTISQDGTLSADNQTQPPINHTGDVTGTQTLTIQPNVVNNSKMAKMPSKTLKGNINSTTSDSQDILIADFKQELNITHQTYIYENYPQTVQLRGRLTTALYLDNVKQTTTPVVTIPNGEFDGQQIVALFKHYGDSTDFEFNGRFIRWAIDNTNLTVVNGINKVHETLKDPNIFWSAEKNAWIVKTIR